MSATGFVDACGFIPTAGGTGNFVASAAIQGYQLPATAGAANGTVYSYRAESADKSQWEEGFGADSVAGSVHTITRSTITANSSGGTTAINFTVAPNVFITALSADLQNASLLVNGTLPIAAFGMPTLKAAAFFTVSGTTVAIVKSFNVASVTRTAAANYTVAFTNAFADANYYCSSMVDAHQNGTEVAFAALNSGTGAFAKLTTACSFAFFASPTVGVDPLSAYILFFE